MSGINALKPRIVHTAYFVNDIERSLKFYRDVLGMKELQRFELGEGVHEVLLSFPESKGSGVILMWNTNRTVPYQKGDGYSRLVMMVSDLNAAMEQMAREGVTITKQATEVGTLRYCMIADPDEYIIELVQIKRA